MSPETNTETQNTAAATTGSEDTLGNAVKIASDLLVVNRDQKNAAIVLAGMTAEEQAHITGFISRVNAQANASKNVYKLIQEQAKQRNAGKPTRSRKPKADAAPADSKKK